jgi:hypothetical protein
MFDERTTVGLDVHARSVMAEAVDWSTGQVFSQRLVPVHEEVLGWVRRLPGPVAVTYEAGPTGFGLARAFAAAGIRCEVVAPSKLERPPGDRIKTDRRDARRLARLLHIGEITGIRVPSPAQESARDLIRAREAARADLMRARHRCSKLLLRHGIVYSDGKAWTGVHEQWLRAQRFELPGTRRAFDEAFGVVLATAARRDRLDVEIAALATDTAWAPVVSRLCAVRGVATLPGPGWPWRSGTGTGSPGRASGPTSAWCPPSPPPAPNGPRARSPRPATPTPGGCSWKPPGTTSDRYAPRARRSAPAATGSRPPCRPAARPPTSGCTAAGRTCKPARSAPPSSPSPWPVSSPAGAGAWPS